MNAYLASAAAARTAGACSRSAASRISSWNQLRSAPENGSVSTRSSVISHSSGETASAASSLSAFASTPNSEVWNASRPT